MCHRMGMQAPRGAGGGLLLARTAGRETPRCPLGMYPGCTIRVLQGQGACFRGGPGRTNLHWPARPHAVGGAHMCRVLTAASPLPEQASIAA